MTITEKSYKNKNYYISLDIEKGYENFYYCVRAYPIIGGICGYPERSMTYSINEKKKAYATFNRYKKKYI